MYIQLKQLTPHRPPERRLVKFEVYDSRGPDRVFGVFDRDECLLLARHLREIADELEDN